MGPIVQISTDRLDSLIRRESEDRRGVCIGIFHRLRSLRDGRVESGSSKRFFANVDEMLWRNFEAGALIDVRLTNEIYDRYPGEDDPVEFDLDGEAIPCFAAVVRAAANPECPILRETQPGIIEQYIETVWGTVQISLYPGVVTSESERLVWEHPQVMQELRYLDALLEKSWQLDDRQKRLDFERWVKTVCVGDLWAPLNTSLPR